jgi:hypothetical protein
MSVQATVIPMTDPNALFSSSEGRLLRSVPAKERPSAYIPRDKDHGDFGGASIAVDQLASYASRMYAAVAT